MAQDKILVGLDIGTSWTRCVIGSASRDGQLMIESIAERPTEGVKSGSIVNIEQTLKVINSVVSDAELQAGTEVSSVILGVGGDHIRGIQSSGRYCIRSFRIFRLIPVPVSRIRLTCSVIVLIQEFSW